MVVAIDAGRHATKVCIDKGCFKFPSLLGEWMDRTGFRESVYGEYDLEIEYEGHKYFGGTLAQWECDWGMTNHTENAKLSIENLILILTAIHLVTDSYQVNVITAQPISSHTDDNKIRIKEMLKGRKEIMVNGIKKSFHINDVAVACEGGVAAYSLPSAPGVIRILDIGSATINGATLIDGRFNKNQSKSLPFGMETTSEVNLERMARKVLSEYSRKWKSSDMVYVVGGAGESFFPYVKEIFPKAYLHPQAQFANVLGLWKVGKGIWS